MSAPTRTLSRRGGFTLVEVLVATALLGFSLVVMFGFHSQAVRSNRIARKTTDCTYLAQSQMETLLSETWTRSGGRTGDLTDGTAAGASEWSPLYHPNGGSDPTPVNALGESYGSESAGQPVASYYVSWQVAESGATGDWVQIWVRCAWEDSTFGTWHGTTISTYKFMDS